MFLGSKGNKFGLCWYRLPTRSSTSTSLEHVLGEATTWDTVALVDTFHLKKNTSRIAHAVSTTGNDFFRFTVSPFIHTMVL